MNLCLNIWRKNDNGTDVSGGAIGCVCLYSMGRCEGRRREGGVVSKVNSVTAGMDGSVGRIRPAGRHLIITAINIELNLCCLS